jgi:hypothetical protein
MAIFKNSTFGNIRKSIGDDIAYRMGGQNILRKKPASVNDANSIAQQGRRSALKVLVALYRTIQVAVKTGFVSRKAKHSAYNAFMATNLKDAVGIVNDTATILWNSLLVASGSMPIIGVDDASIDSQNGLELEITNRADNVLLFDADKVVVVAISETNSHVAFVREFALGTYVYNMGINGFALNERIQLYAFFKSADGHQTSDSVHLTSHTMV